MSGLLNDATKLIAGAVGSALGLWLGTWFGGRPPTWTDVIGGTVIGAGLMALFNRFTRQRRIG